MSIGFACECGKQLRMKEEVAGRKFKCPACGVISVAPVPAESSPSSNPGYIVPNPFEYDQWKSPVETGTPIRSANVSANLDPPKCKVNWKDVIRRHRRSLACASIGLVVLTSFCVLLTWENPDYEGKSFSEWSRQIYEKNMKAKLAAFDAIGFLGRDGHASLTIPVYVRVIASNEPADIKRLAVDELAIMGCESDGTYVLRRLVRELTNSEISDLTDNIGRGIGRVVAGSSEISMEEGWEAIQLVIDKLGLSDDLDDPIERIIKAGGPDLSREVMIFLGQYLEKGEMQAAAALHTLFHLAYDEENITMFDPAMPFLVQHIRSDIANEANWRSRYGMVDLLVRVGGPKVAVPVCVEILSQYSRLRDSAIYAFIEMGPGAKEAIPFLKRYIREDPRDDKAKEALAAIRGW